MKYVAYFAKTVTVTFNENKESGTTTSREYVVGDTLVEDKDYNGYDYAALPSKSPEGASYAGKGTSYYPGTPTNTDLNFGGWYYNTTSYATYNGTVLGNLAPIQPTPSTLPLVAKWHAVITFYPDDGTNNANLTGTGLTETSSGSGVYTYNHDVGLYNSGTGKYSGVFNYGASYSPTISDLSFNGWYVLGAGGTVIGDIEPVASGINSNSPYPDTYGTKKRLEPGTVVSAHTSLMALYVATVEFYFNGADGIDASVTPTAPYSVTVQASIPVNLGDSPFYTINGAMTDPDTYKHDTKGEDMVFMGWYKSVDGSTPPVTTDVMYKSTTTITANVKLIAGWGITVDFSNNGVPGISDTVTSSEWIPGGYGFTVLEGTVFSSADTLEMDMPELTLDGKPLTSWYDKSTAPYTWYTHNVTEYTYSVTLTPEFGDLFQFNMMGGDLGVVNVAYTVGDEFSIVLERLYESLLIGSTYVDLTKPGLYYDRDGAAVSPGAKPNAVWYKDDGAAATDNTTNPAIIYIGNQGSLVTWGSTDQITASTDAYAYIRWMADVSFDRNVPSPDAGTTANPTTITGIDEGTAFSTLSPLSVLQYNTAGDKTFKGWYVGTTQYAAPDGTVVAGAPAVTETVTLVAKWSVEVKFYYTGTYSGAGAGSDSGGTYVIIEVASNNKVTAPSISKMGFINGHLLWYENGFTGTVPVNVQNFNGPEGFDMAQDILVNKTLYARWYAEVTFSVTPAASGFFTSVIKYVLEGAHLGDIAGDLDPYAGDSQRADWKFIGWFDISSASGYEDLGTQYYRTSFDYLQSGGAPPSDSTSEAIVRNITLNREYVVLVDFDSGYDGAASIPSKYLRVEKPLPANSDERFTPKPGRSGVTFTGWYDLSVGKKYTENVPGSDAPNAEPVTKSMTLTATWLVVVKFFDLPVYLTAGLQFASTAMVVWENGPDGNPGTADDYFEMPEGTTIRQFIIVDPSAAGRTFVSWFAEQGTANGLYAIGDIFYGLSDRISADVTLTAGYGYSVHFDTNGGTPSSIPDAMVIEGQSIQLPETPAKGRLTFSGWDDTSTVLGAGETVTPNGETTYSAKWLVVVKLYDGISMTSIATLEWDEDDGPDFDYATTAGTGYDGGVTEVKITWTDGSGMHEVTLSKFIDRYDSTAQDWVSLYSVFDGWVDPFTGQKFASTGDLETLLTGSADSAALFATWKERARFYEGSTLLQTDYVESGEYLGTAAPSASGWADLYNPTSPLNPSTYRIRDSGDFVAIEFLTVTFEGNGGTPAQQVFQNVISGQMLGLIGNVQEPTRSGMYFAGWYKGDVKYSFTDRIYENAVFTAKWQSTPVERYTIFASAHADASISPLGMISVMRGDTISFDFNVKKGFTPVVTVDGHVVSHGRLSSYTFSNVLSDHSIEISVGDADRGTTDKFLYVYTNGMGDVLYSVDGSSFVNYVQPLPLHEGTEYFLKAVPKASSHFNYWSGNASGGNPELHITSDGLNNINITANFSSSSGFFGGSGELGILNLICVVLSIVIGLIAVTLARKRDLDGTGTGKALRFGALFIALISAVIFILTQGFGGQYVPYDEWSIVMVILTLVTLALALVSIRYDYVKE
ncbi:MAG: InlB B-repeat-containing protein [Candidatus Methanoplasma sp.]|jgi:hypothetical protein|nr:InlB B-repeat-containing protein [Candidatus Methanoplasma sp.]